MNYLINYADGLFTNSRVSNSISGIKAGFDGVIQYSRKDIDPVFLNKNEQILNETRGAGYWLWKPYFIFKTLNNVQYGDTVFYSDSGAQFIKPVKPLIDLIDKHDIVGFKMSGNHKESQYTRKSVLSSICPDNLEIAHSNQDMASFIGVKKTLSTVQDDHVIGSWLKLCENPDLIKDKPRSSDEFKEFIDHRHDQSIWSLVSKMRNVYKAPDPSQWGINSGETKEIDFFIDHHRSRT